MSDSIKWTERRFNFDFPTGLYRNVIERLRGTPARAQDLISSIPTSVQSIRDGEHWSIKEHLGHLIDVEHLFNQRLDDYDAGADVLRSADLTNRLTYDAGYNERAIESICSEVRGVRSVTIKRLELVKPHDFGRTALHSRLAVRMRLVDLMVFHAEHDDHHLARMTELSSVTPVASRVTQEAGTRSALVCDDKPYIRKVIGKVLEQVGVTVVGEAETGVEAVQKYRELSPDLVTMDIIMPGMSGLDAVREILSFDPAAHVLVCSGLGQEALVAKAMNAGAKGYVLKPFTLSDLLEAIQVAL